MTVTKSPKASQKKNSQAKALRNEAIRAMSIEGKTTQEIADAVGIRRESVSRVLNSAETKAAVEEAKGRVAAMIDEALETLLVAIKSRYGDDLPTAFRAAQSVLKNYGVLKEKLEVDATIKAKPFIVERLSGEQVVMGIQDVKEQDND